MAQYMLPGGPMIDTGSTARQYMLPGGPMVSVPGGADVTIALTGSAVTASAGTIATALSLALAGSAATAAAGTLVPAISIALAGASAAANAGTITVSAVAGGVVTVYHSVFRRRRGR